MIDMSTINKYISVCSRYKTGFFLSVDVQLNVPSNSKVVCRNCFKFISKNDNTVEISI